MDQPPNPEEKLDKISLHPVVKKVNTIISYAILEYHDSKIGKYVNKKKLSPEELNLYLSKLHTRVYQELENNKEFREITLGVSRLILQVISGGNIT